MKNEFIIISKLEFESSKEEKLFMDLVKKIYDKIELKISTITPEVGLADVSKSKIDISDVANKFVADFKNKEIVVSDMLWLINEVAIGSSPEGLMLSFSCEEEKFERALYRTQKVLDAMGAKKGKVLWVSSGEEKFMEFGIKRFGPLN